MRILPDFHRDKERYRHGAAYGIIFALLITGCKNEQPSGTGPLFPASSGANVGFIDNRGKMVIAARYESALPFSEGLAGVKREGRWGYIDRNGSEVIPIRYRSAQGFKNGVAIVDSGLPDHPVGLIDTQGAWVLQPLFRALTPGDTPDAPLMGQKDASEGSGYYDRSGNMVLGPYFMAYPFSEGRARVKKYSVRGHDDWIVDTSGNFLARHDEVLDGVRYSEGLIAVRRERMLGYMDLYGNVVIEPRYSQGGEFSEGLAAVESEGHWMFVDKNGTVAAHFPAGTVFVYPLSEGLALVTAARDSDRKFGYVDRNAQWVIRPAWDDAESFHDGLAYVGIWKDQKAAYIDHKGRSVWEGRSSQP
jgi:hypothetical protein